MTDARRGWLDENIDASVVMRASNRGHSSAVEHRIADPAVAGSNPAGPFLFFFDKNARTSTGVCVLSRCSVAPTPNLLILFSQAKKMHAGGAVRGAKMRRPGIKPGSSPWQGLILSLYYRR